MKEANMEEPVRVDLLFPRSGQRLGVYLPLETVATLQKQSSGTWGVTGTDWPPEGTGQDLDRTERERSQH